MEGAALHYMGRDLFIPFIQLRAVSNYIGERDKNKWKMHGDNEIDIHLDDLIITFSNRVHKFYLDGSEWKDILDDYLYDRKDTYNTYVYKHFPKIWVEAKNKVQWKGQQNKI
jgi:hypothetical protein